jgi:hypothetical protein
MPAPASAPRSHSSRPRWYWRRSFSRCDARRAAGEVGIEQIRRRGRRDAARFLHGLEFGEQRQRHRRRAVGDLVEEYTQAAHGVIDEVDDGLNGGGGKLLDPHQLPLDLVGERDDRIEADHLDGPCRLMHVRARVLQRRRVGGIAAEGRERFAAARQRFVDFTLDPRQRPEIELGCGFTQHAWTPRCPSIAVRP